MWTDTALPNERCLVPVLFRPWARDLIERADLENGVRVVDVASGTGVVARLAARKLGNQGTVYGWDPNPRMLEMARSASLWRRR